MWIHVVIFVMILCALTGWKKDGFHLPESEGRMVSDFCGSSDSRKSAGHDPYFAKRWTGVSSGIPSGKEDTGSYEKEFMVSVDGEEPVSMYIQVPEKELEEQEEEPKQNKKLTRKNRHKKYCRGSIPV